jgi:hypothetical protein
MARKILMMRLMKAHWQTLLNILLAGALAAMLVFFGALGRTADAPAADGRIRLLLDNRERDFVLNEMRHLLMSSQAILEAALGGDMTRVAAEARKVGMADVKIIPPEIRGPLVGKLPIEFKRLGFGTHEAFDQLALDAETLGDREHTLAQLAALQKNCIACHATYTVLPPSAAR